MSYNHTEKSNFFQNLKFTNEKVNSINYICNEPKGQGEFSLCLFLPKIDATFADFAILCAVFAVEGKEKTRHKTVLESLKRYIAEMD